ncbi:MAG: BON domain-containing protein [Planctomycetaceae bacterium]|nr:BON domain-containing protein [Planctomycetaceae bacterium]
MAIVNEGRIDSTPGTQGDSKAYVAPWQPTIDEAQAALLCSPYLPLRQLRCDYHEGVLSIRGRVPTFYLKQLAQTVVSRVPGVEQVANRVEVIPPGQPLPGRQEPTVEHPGSSVTAMKSK